MKTLLLTLFFLIAFQFNGYCQKTNDTSAEKIAQIRYDLVSGAKYGTDQHLSITQDSIIYDSRMGYYRLSVRIHIPNRTDLWLDLVKLINLEEFDKINNGESMVSSDGSDEYITVQTSVKSHKEVNGRLYNNSINSLKDKLKNIISDLKNYL